MKKLEVVDHGQLMQLDGGYCCASCGKVTWILGCWKKQLNIAKDALELWERMRQNNWPVDFILYNTLLNMCADVGLVEEAETLFSDMKQSEHCRPDSWSYLQC
ncbi:hypothetical protein K1719_016707 [Acacia pycnantha]|nr:hypothetical protein K1719_016707 [Acacia pycnantha]